MWRRHSENVSYVSHRLTIFFFCFLFSRYVHATLQFVNIGIVTNIEVNHKQIDCARKGQEVCIKITPTPGDAPKLYGRHFDHKDMLVSKVLHIPPFHCRFLSNCSSFYFSILQISRESIDACKEYFRDDLQKPDWQLMVELKKLFQIL